MKKKLIIYILILTCLTLIECSPGKLFEYNFIVSNSLNENEKEFPIKLDNDLDLFIKCGYYKFYGYEDPGLVAVITVYSKKDKNIQNFIKSVRSSTMGELVKKDSLPYLISPKKNDILYNLQFKKRKDRKRYNKTRKDTITFELHSGKKFLFERKIK